jgi:hypothetical protein
VVAGQVQQVAAIAGHPAGDSPQQPVLTAAYVIMLSRDADVTGSGGMAFALSFSRKLL